MAESLEYLEQINTTWSNGQCVKVHCVCVFHQVLVCRVCLKPFHEFINAQNVKHEACLLYVLYKAFSSVLSLKELEQYKREQGKSWKGLTLES